MDLHHNLAWGSESAMMDALNRLTVQETQSDYSQQRSSYDTRMVDELRKIADLYKEGLLTKEEYEKFKSKILS